MNCYSIKCSSFILFFRLLLPGILFLFLSREIFPQSLLYPSLPPDYITSVCFLDYQQVIFTNSGGSIYKSYDNGNTWQLKAYFQGCSLSDLKFIDDKTGYAIAENYYETLEYIVYTSDRGETWGKVISNELGSVSFLPVSESIALIASSFFRISRVDSLHKSKITYKIPEFAYNDPEHGIMDIPYGTISKLQMLPSGLIIAQMYNNYAKMYSIQKDSMTVLLSSRDSGLTWDTLWAGSGGGDLVMTDNNNGWMLGGKIFYRTTDGGKSWNPVKINLQGDPEFWTRTALDSQSVIGTVSFGLPGKKVPVMTTDAGNSWEIFPGDLEGALKMAFRNKENGFAFGSNIYRTVDSGRTWEKLTDKIFADIIDLNFMNIDTGFALGNDGIYKTTDGGKRWQSKLKFRNLDVSPGSIKMVNGSTGWCSKFSEGRIYKTDDSGESWEEIKLSDKIQFYKGIDFYNENLGIINTVSEYDIESSGTLLPKYHLLTTDGGRNWSKVIIDTAIKAYDFEKMRFIAPGHLWALNKFGLWHSSDSARTWRIMFGRNYLTEFHSFDFYDSTYGVVATSYSKAYITTDGGTTWKENSKWATVSTKDCRMLGPDKDGLFRVIEAGKYGKLIEYDFDSSGNVRNHSALNSYTNLELRKIEFAYSNDIPYVWITGEEFILLQKQYEKVVIHEKEPPTVIKSFLLSQNYPNPFNSGTTILYSIPQRSYVKLQVFDVLGRKVRVLMDDQQNAGEYKVQFNASSLPSGVYYYMLQSGQFSDTKKLLLLK